jgi:serine O-acetyltransferase
VNELSSLRNPLHPEAGYSLASVVAAICAANADFAPGTHGEYGPRPLPSRQAIAQVMTALRATLFPWHFGASDISAQGLDYYVGRTLDAALVALREQIEVACAFEAGHSAGSREPCSGRASAVVHTLATRLPVIRALLGRDALAAFEGDPAATSVDEAIFSYAGVTAISYHRIAHELHRMGVPLVPRMISELAHQATGIDIHPGAAIGSGFFIDHGTGVVIGETCQIGERVRLYQGVTLGAKRFPTDERGRPLKGIPRHPIVEDDVVIYAGATVLGRITIGRGSSIGGNVWLTHSVPPATQVTQAQVRQELFDDGAGI